MPQFSHEDEQQETPAPVTSRCQNFDTPCPPWDTLCPTLIGEYQSHEKLAAPKDEIGVPRHSLGCRHSCPRPEKIKVNQGKSN
jgi:hypothetical protein